MSPKRRIQFCAVMGNFPGANALMCEYHHAAETLDAPPARLMELFADGTLPAIPVQCCSL